MIIFAFCSFFAMIFYLLWGVIWNLIKLFFVTLWQVFIGIYSACVLAKLDRSGFTENKLLEERLEEAAKQNKHNDQILGQHNRIIKAAMIALNEMRIKYPYSDESLFKEYQQKFSSASVKQLQDIEEKIRASHTRNEINYSVNGRTCRQYTLADINGLEPLEERREDPIIMRIYKIDTDYILHIKDIDINGNYLLQSKDYFVIVRVQLKVAETQKELYAMKRNIQAHQINDIFSNVSVTTQDFRRTRMGFID